MILKYTAIGDTHYDECDSCHFSYCEGDDLVKPHMVGYLEHGDTMRVVNFEVGYLMEHGKTIDRISVQQYRSAI